MNDLYHNLKFTGLNALAAVTATITPVSVDRQGFERLMFKIDADLWVDGTFTFGLEDSDDDAVFTAVTDVDFRIGNDPVILGVTNDNTIYKVEYLGGKRYVQMTCVVTAGPVTGLVFGIEAVQGEARDAPVASAVP